MIINQLLHCDCFKLKRSVIRVRKKAFVTERHKMKFNLLLLVIMEAIRMAHGTCVLESDFGFILNCNFKKSGLFRVRNLGGVKAHFGLGFSVGDELGFAESLGNLEGNRRRALNYRTGAGPNNIGVLPASKLPPVPPPPAMASQSPHKVQKSFPVALTPRPHMAPRAPPTRISSIKRSGVPSMTEAAYLPMGVPAFRPIPPTTPRSRIGQVAIQSNTANVAVNNKIVEPTPFQAPGKNMTFAQVLPMKSVSQNLIGSDSIPPFQSLPSSVSRVSNADIVEIDNGFSPMIPPDVPRVDLMGHSVEELAAAANVSVEAIKQAIFLRQQQLLAEYRAAQIRNQLIRDAMTSTTTMRTTSRTTTPVTTTTTVMPTKRPTMKPSVATGKVMNAPKEYYPVGYDKNFDDNFTSKVDLPPTSFTCGDQKHFPGLYADVDLGCMVFHVCALTDEGLIMKSFLCPESTLFDQTVLKCNWWFYVDCKSSRDLYDSNIPISKSYQLMKSLTYFSNFNKNANKDKEELDIEALKNTVVSESDTSSNPT